MSRSDCIRIYLGRRPREVRGQPCRHFRKRSDGRVSRAFAAVGLGPANQKLLLEPSRAPRLEIRAAIPHQHRAG